jgi:enamine deaminase RidA (YjgF/YER057c/UK114 family)
MGNERQLIASGSPFERTIGFSRAVRVGNRVIVAGTAPIWPDGTCDPDPEVQARRCLEIITTALAEAGARPEDVVRTRQYLTDAGHADAVGRAHGAVFSEIRPASTMVVVAALLDPRWKVEIEAEAVIGGEQASSREGEQEGQMPSAPSDSA